MRTQSLLCLLLALVAALPATAQKNDERRFAIVGCRVLPVEGAPITEGVILTHGTKIQQVGSTADVKEYVEKRSSMPNEVQFDGFGTVARNVFAIGDAEIPLTEVNQ